MSIGMFIAGAIIVYAIMYFVASFALFDKMEKKYSWEKARKLCVIIPIISALLGGLLIGYAGGTRFAEGSYIGQRCDVCGDSVEQGYKVNKMFSTYYACEKHGDYARELAGLAPSKSNRSKSNRLEDTCGHDEFDAVVVAEKAVKSKLKSPSTAEFCSHKEYSITCSGDTWTVSGYVDAQNSFGATLRNDFTVMFTFENSERYTIDYCNISE